MKKIRNDIKNEIIIGGMMFFLENDQIRSAYDRDTIGYAFLCLILRFDTDRKRYRFDRPG